MSGFLRGCALLLLFVTTVGCAARQSFVSTPGPYDRLPSDSLERVRGARASYDAGDLVNAHSLLAEVLFDHARHVPTSALQQDVELALLASGVSVRGIPTAGATPEALEAELAARYEERSEAFGTPEAHVLAARLQRDPERALVYLGRVDALDSRCIWMHYARAWVYVSERRFPEAREALAKARALDKGHLPTLRLQATLLAGGGSTAEAAEVLEVWLERSADSPFVSAGELAEATVDLAACLVLVGEPDDAVERLDEVDVSLLSDPAREAMVRAAAYESANLPGLALRASRRARELAPDDLMPRVQEAILLGGAWDDLGPEEVVWNELLDEAQRQREAGAQAPLEEAEDSAPEFRSLLIQLHAHTRLERLDRERAAANP